jgi:hypothetical protein
MVGDDRGMEIDFDGLRHGGSPCRLCGRVGGLRVSTRVRAAARDEQGCTG